MADHQKKTKRIGQQLNTKYVRILDLLGGCLMMILVNHGGV